MKKLFITALAAIAIGTSAFAAPASISKKVNAHFRSSFSNASEISWTKTEKFNKASFLIDNEKIEAFYDTYGDLIGTSKSIQFDKLPKSAIETITSKYTFPDYQVLECIEFVNADNEKNYYVSMDKNDATVVLEITKKGMVSLYNKIWK
jgi:hypothetical protein